MNTEEKLDHFYEMSIEAAQADAQKLIDEHKAGLEKIFNDHKETRLRQAEAELKMASDKIKRDFNKQISLEQLNIRQKQSQLREELTNKLFDDVEQKLMAFKQTPDYLQTLCRQIKKAASFAGADAIQIFIDPSDTVLREQLCCELETQTGRQYEPEISDVSFLGGIRAIIPEKNILIDYSFVTLMKDELAQFAPLED